MVPRVEVWSTLACQGGTALGRLAWVSLRTESTWDDVVVVERATVRCLPPAAGLVRLQRALVLVLPDGTITEYRITQVTADDQILTIVAEGPLHDLARASTPVYERVGGRVRWTPAIAPATPSALLSTWVVPFAPTYVALGTVDPTTVCWPSPLSGTPLAAARAIAAAARLASGMDLGLRLRRNGTTNYLLDLVDVGASEPTVRLRAGHGTNRIVREEQTVGQLTRAQVIGQDGRGLGDNWWSITGVSANAYLEVADLGGSAQSPIVEDGALTGAAVRLHDSATLYPITGSTAASRRLHMNPTPPSPVGKFCTIVTSTGDELGWLDAPAAQTIYGVVLGTVTRPISGVTNWVPNGDMADWTGTRPASWTGTGTGPTKVTSVGDWESGGQSARYVDTAFASVVSPGTNLRCTTGTVITHAARVRVDVPGALVVRIPDPVAGISEDVALDSTFSPVGVWVYIVRQYRVATSGILGLGGIGLFASGLGTALLDHVLAYVDTEGSQPSGYVRSSGGATLWLAGIQALHRYSEPRLRYEVELADFSAPGIVAPGPPAVLRVGAPIEILDATQGWQTTTRIRRVARTWETGRVQIDVAALAPALADQFGGR